VTLRIEIGRPSALSGRRTGGMRLAPGSGSQAVQVTTMNPHAVFPRLRTARRAGFVWFLFLLSGAAWAQEGLPAEPAAGDVSLRNEAALRFAAPAPGFIEFGRHGSSLRPRLRFRFDAATRAVRSLGVEAEDCSSLLRSSSRSRASTPGGGERRSLGLSIAVSCRFF
jgi:hypothetical protein